MAAFYYDVQHHHHHHHHQQTGRDNALAKLYDSLEERLELLGVTAVEDRLQEEVAETMSTLREGGCKLWVLTGDKVETAMEISLAAG